MLRGTAGSQTLQVDVQELARRASALAAAEPKASAVALLRRLIESVSTAALVADNHGRFVATNAAAAKLTGYTALELARLSVWQITPGVNEHEAETLWRAFRQRHEQHGEYQVLTKSGRLVAAEYAAQTDILPNFHLSLLRPIAPSRL